MAELRQLSELIGEERDREAQAYYQLRIVYNLLNRLGSANIECYGVRAAYYGVLYALQNGKEMYPSQLSHFVLSGVSNITALIDRMNRDGLVFRRRDEQDRRKVLICLTERGEAASRQVVAGHVGWIQKTMSALGDQNLEQLEQLMALLWQALQRQPVEASNDKVTFAKTGDQEAAKDH